MHTNPTILLVDDQPDLLYNLSLTLTTHGYDVLTADNGLAAFDLLQNHTVALVIADIAMPGLNGYQLLERVRANPAWTAMQFVFLTARTMDSDIRYGKSLGVDDYLTKPIQPEDLLATVQGKLQRAQQLQPSAANSLAQKKLGRLEINIKQHQIFVDGAEVKLSAREFSLLAYLAQHANEVVAPADLIKVTHNLDTDDSEAGTLLRPLVRSIRRKLGYEVGEMGCIENVRSTGYRLTPL